MTQQPETFSARLSAWLAPDLQALEQRRHSVVTWTLGSSFALVLLLGVLAVAMASTRGGMPPWLLLIMIPIGLLIGMGIYQYASQGYREEFKERIIRRVIAAVDPGLAYSPQASLDEGTFMGSLLFTTRPDRFRGEDLVWGTVGVTSVRFSELHAEYKTHTTDSKGHSRTEWHTIFKGIFFVADFNKHFAGATVVLPDRAQSLLGGFGQTLQSWSARLDGRPGELVKLEDPEFEDAFVVSSTDQVEARYILSPSLMRRLLDYRRRCGAEIYVSFIASQIYVGIRSQKNHFEAPVFRSLLEPGLLDEYLESLWLALGIVEELNLNTRIWSKGPALAPVG